jgi:hypothetical protein
MKLLKTEFRKNGLDYTLIKRTDKIALFQLGPSLDPDGYEVCRIYFMLPLKFLPTFKGKALISLWIKRFLVIVHWGIIQSMKNKIALKLNHFPAL